MYKTEITLGSVLDKIDPQMTSDDRDKFCDEIANLVISQISEISRVTVIRKAIKRPYMVSIDAIPNTSEEEEFFTFLKDDVEGCVDFLVAEFSQTKRSDLNV